MTISVEVKYKIRGQARKQLKSQYHQLKRFIKYFWYYHQLDKDMCSFYGCATESYPMNDQKAEMKYKSACDEADELKRRLDEIEE